MIPPTSQQDSPIRTPDQRLRVFVSSTLGEMAEERAAARTAIEQLRLIPVMFELGARPHPPRALYRAYLEQSDVFVGVYWQRYGWVAPDMDISGLEDEFRLSSHLPRLMYLKRPAPDIEPRLGALLSELAAQDAISYKPFSTAEELTRLLLDDLAILLTERFASGPSTAGMESVPVPQPTTRLVGREANVDEVTSVLVEEGRRLVTLTGTGGIGKTRLAIAVAEATREHWADGVVFVDLSTITDPSAVLPSVATACGVRTEGNETPLGALVRRLAGRRLLLVLDNFEQVIPAAAEIAILLQRCPGISILVTSRIVLRVRGEVGWPVSPLETAPADAPLGALQHAPAVQLLVERARDMRPSFELTPDNAGALGELCRRLDGLPLALELAAPRLRLLTPAQVLERLDHRLEAGGGFADLPERQRTLSATLDWSHHLLGAEAKTVFARLAVLSGPFTIDAAEAVSGWDGADVVTALSALVDHSLVSPSERPDGKPGFRMLETVRAYAMARLKDGTDAEATFYALERHLTEIFDRAAPRLQSSDQGGTARQLDAEVENLFSVLRWAETSHRVPGPLVRAFSRCWVYWQIRAHAQRLPDLSDLTAASPAAGMTAADWAAVHFAQAGMLFSSGRFEDVVDLASRVIGRMEEVGEEWQVALMLTILAISRPFQRGGPARSEFERAIAILTAAEDRINRAYTLSHMGDFLLNEGDVEKARAAHEEALHLAGVVGDPNLMAESEFHLAYDCLYEADPMAAGDHLTVAIAHYRDLDHLDGKARCLRALSALALLEGDPALAARLVGAGEALRDRIGIRPWPPVAELEARYAERINQALAPDKFETEVAIGRDMPTDEALSAAFSFASQPRC